LQSKATAVGFSIIISACFLVELSWTSLELLDLWLRASPGVVVMALNVGILTLLCSILPSAFVADI
jgi:hypothetical protein